MLQQSTTYFTKSRTFSQSQLVLRLRNTLAPFFPVISSVIPFRGNEICIACIVVRCNYEYPAQPRVECREPNWKFSRDSWSRKISFSAEEKWSIRNIPVTLIRVQKIRFSYKSTSHVFFHRREWTWRPIRATSKFRSIEILFHSHQF